ncbi:hypothetical protein AVEN_44250-1, partial [Araneus ventricosus]
QQRGIFWDRPHVLGPQFDDELTPVLAPLSNFPRHGRRVATMYDLTCSRPNAVESGSEPTWNPTAKADPTTRATCDLIKPYRATLLQILQYFQIKLLKHLDK